MGRSRGGVFSAAPLYSGRTPRRYIQALLRGALHKPVARAPRLASSAPRMLWFPDLTQHDPYYMLPVLSGLSLSLSRPIAIP